MTFLFSLFPRPVGEFHTDQSSSPQTTTLTTHASCLDGFRDVPVPLKVDKYQFVLSSSSLSTPLCTNYSYTSYKNQDPKPEGCITENMLKIFDKTYYSENHTDHLHNIKFLVYELLVLLCPRLSSIHCKGPFVT